MKFKRYATFTAAAVAAFVLAVPQVFAHATVQPAEVGVGKNQIFVLSVPNEKDVATVAVRVVIPANVSSVTPNVKPGWNIEIKKEKTGKQVANHHGDMVDEERVSEVVWTNGSIPAGQRDEFMFSAKVPTEPTTIQWKAYQTYAGGVVVAWDKDPKVLEAAQAAMAEQMKTNPDMKMEESNSGPYSQTNVIDDLKAEVSAPATAVADSASASTSNRNSIIALVISILSLVTSLALSRRARA